VKPALTPWLRPAQGFFDLGMFDAAWANLDNLEPTAKAHPETLLFRLEILFAQNRWADAASLGAGYCRDWPTCGEFFFKTANALMILTDYEKALVLLRSAPESHHRDPWFHYWVASCACGAGRLEEAKAALGECHWDFTIQQMVDINPVFESLWQAYGPLSQWGLTSTDPRIDARNHCDWSKGHRIRIYKV
jgi:tetratricopeptide (TPR) repeat protein